MRLYVIRDALLGESMPIWEQKNDAVAVRSYLQSIRSAPNQSDFRLYCVGEYDHVDDKGFFFDRPIEVPTVLSQGVHDEERS